MDILKQEYEQACTLISDIHEHVPTLFNLAKQCKSVTEFGVRSGISTRAFLYANVKLRAYDLNKDNYLNALFNLAKLQKRNVEYIQANVLKIKIEQTDLLFIDTFHVYNQLQQELFIHAPFVNKYIVFHDTYTYGITGEDGGQGIFPVILEFLVDNPNWRLKQNFTNNNGLTIIENTLNVVDLVPEPVVINNSNMKLQTLDDFINDPKNPIYNFKLGLEYESLNQTASAASFYLRAAEKTTNLILQYTALLRNGLCFEKQGNRDLTVKTIYQRAISVLPNRPEAYYLLSKLHERREEFHDCYMLASIGLNICQTNSQPYLDNLEEFKFEYGLKFEKGVSSWWVGLNEESRELMFDLYYNYDLDEIHKDSVQINLNNLGLPKHKFVYSKSYLNELTHKFENAELIENNYSQVYQDMFVLTMLDGKQNGTYLEIGSNDPFYNNNTALLETVFNWTGISVEIDHNQVVEFNSKRKNLAICSDALAIDYKKLLDNNNFLNVIDYLQVDCDPPDVSFQVLQKVIESGYKFKIITFEHDFYYNKSIKFLSRDYLTSKGYHLLISDVSFNKTNSFEDWWVLKEYVNSTFYDLDNKVNFVTDIFFK